jgi:hypothetical protein
MFHQTRTLWVFITLRKKSLVGHREITLIEALAFYN